VLTAALTSCDIASFTVANRVSNESSSDPSSVNRDFSFESSSLSLPPEIKENLLLETTPKPGVNFIKQFAPKARHIICLFQVPIGL
jgi:hypothetical protein